MKTKKPTPAKLPAKRGRGKPRHVFCPVIDEQVENLSGIGIPVDKIGLIVKISKPTILSNYSDALERGRAKALTQISQRLFDIAMGTSRDSLTACIFWLKCQAGWKPPADVEVNIDNSNKTATVINLPAEQEDALKRVIEDAQKRVKRIP